MPDGAALGVLLCALLIVVVAIGTLIGAVFLRAAIAVYNLQAGGASSPSSVPMPAFRKAMWITFDTSVAHLVAGLLILGLFPGDGAAAPGTRGPQVDVAAQLLFVPVSFFIAVGVLCAKVPTTFVRAILITLFDMLLVVLVVGVLVGIVVLLFGVARYFWGA